MPPIFGQALPPQQPPTPAPPGDVFNQVMAELARMEATETPTPAMSLDKQREAVGANNSAMQLGALGAMSPLHGPQEVGGQIFKQALARNTPHVTERGTTDQLTGDFTPNADITEQRSQARKQRLFNIALASEDKRVAEQARRDAVDQATQTHVDAAAAAQGARQDNIRLAASLRPTPLGADPEMIELKKGLVKAQTDAAQAHVTAAQNKLDQQAEKATMMAQSAASQGAIIIKKIDEALGQSGKWTTGTSGKLFSRIPGTTAYDLNKTIDTIKANVGFEQLNQMRQSSPTGGALGQVAIKELDMLQASVANLDTGQKRETLEANLKQVRDHYSRWVAAMLEHARSMGATRGMDSSATPGAQPSPGAPRSSSQDNAPEGVDPTVWRHMTPTEKSLWQK